MKKEVIKRGLLGIPLGIAIGHVISIIISVILGQGHYVATAPHLIASMNGELPAVIIQAVFSGVLGAAMAASSVIWAIDEWSLAKRTLIHFVIIATVNLPIAYFMGWMEQSLKGIAVYSSIFAIIFLVIWVIQYLTWKAKIKRMNQQVKSMHA